eukprot:TRINITY_DN46368_c0_g1_i1.p1 TRINITY_DN46368_c0_g1~~TRINITY_DN46368_c0_g1_i1.p1  ORF type:complete len:372 (+),score=39.25 TRINITY_DN46368_c0_g1_i1:52-1116(+)
MASGQTLVAVVRHGERLDEVGFKKDWIVYKKQHPEAAYDPPLTEKGWTQARDAGKRMKQDLRDRLDNVTVYSSPTWRTLSTAAAVCKELDASTLIPAYALSCSAAAQRFGVAHPGVCRVPSAEVVAGIECGCWPPHGDAKSVDETFRSGGFVPLVKELAAMSTPGSVVIAVTHREGIWELQSHIGAKRTTSYCSVSYVLFDHENQTLTRMEDPPSERGSRLPPDERKDGAPKGIGQDARKDGAPIGIVHERTKQLRLALHKKADVIQRLSEGCGHVVVHRPGGGGLRTHMWRTPGVRGVWADGGCIPDGETVELLSSPQPSENNEGDFVFVRRASGYEGWVKTKNIRLASSSPN